jgi:hypothetical protein
LRLPTAQIRKKTPRRVTTAWSSAARSEDSVLLDFLRILAIDLYIRFELSCTMENPSLPSNLQSSSSDGNIFSNDPRTRDIELKFLQRLLAANNPSFIKILNAKGLKADSFEQNLAAMQHPFFAWLAKELDQTLPPDATFGRFHDAENPPSRKP